MANIIQWTTNTLIVDPVRNPKKMTGTRLASVLGLNRWATPFETWCAITRTYEKPFEDSIYTIAGKTIEPKQADYCENDLFMDIQRPTDVYGPNPFKATWGDFFKSVPIFGGMWDYLELENGKPVGVLEMKTTKRVEDWAIDIPEYYALQAALYAYLLGLDKVTMVCSFLKDGDYEHPEEFVPSMDNTICRTFYLSERYPNFANTIAKAEKWWNDHVLTGISPEFDETKDAEILKVLRTNEAPTDDDMGKLIEEAENLKAVIDEKKAEMAVTEKRYKAVTDSIKKKMIESFRDGDKTVVTHGNTMDWAVTKIKRTTFDFIRMEEDGIDLDKYELTDYTYTLKPTEKKEGK